MIVMELRTVSDILDNFPILSCQDQLLLEFKRLTDIDIAEVFRQKMNDISQKLYKLSIITSSSQKKKIFQNQEISMALSGSRDEDKRNYLYSCLSLYLLPTLLKECWTDMFLTLNDSRNDSYPRIFVNLKSEELTVTSIMQDRQYCVMAENNVIFESENLVTALAGIVAAYYNFNIAYPKPVSKTLIFLQKEVLDIHDNTAACKKVLTLISKLRSIP